MRLDLSAWLRGSPWFARHLRGSRDAGLAIWTLGWVVTCAQLVLGTVRAPLKWRCCVRTFRKHVGGSPKGTVCIFTNAMLAVGVFWAPLSSLWFILSWWRQPEWSQLSLIKLALCAENCSCTISSPQPLESRDWKSLPFENEKTQPRREDGCCPRPWH